MGGSGSSSPHFRAWRGWEAQGLLPNDLVELRLTLGVAQGRIRMCALDLRQPETGELLGAMVNPSLTGLTPTQAGEWLHEWLDEAMDAAEEWNRPFR